jgi:hypothetical protein
MNGGDRFCLEANIILGVIHRNATRISYSDNGNWQCFSHMIAPIAYNYRHFSLTMHPDPYDIVHRLRKHVAKVLENVLEPHNHAMYGYDVDAILFDLSKASTIIPQHIVLPRDTKNATLLVEYLRVLQRSFLRDIRRSYGYSSALRVLIISRVGQRRALLNAQEVATIMCNALRDEFGKSGEAQNSFTKGSLSRDTHCNPIRIFNGTEWDRLLPVNQMLEVHLADIIVTPHGAHLASLVAARYRTIVLVASCSGESWVSGYVILHFLFKKKFFLLSFFFF